MTLHRDAYDNLPEFAQNPALGCVACHTVGFGEEGGFVSGDETPELEGVQCENCHGPGGAHVSDTAVSPIIDLTAEMCGACHTGFADYRLDRRDVRCMPYRLAPSHLR
jgi:hypothetical protein